MFKQSLRRLLRPLPAMGALLALAGGPVPVAAQQVHQSLAPPIVHKVQAASERMEMTVNTSRRLTLDQKIREVQVSNPDLLEPTVLSPTEVNISAKATGVTQVILWGEDKRVHTVDVIVFADARELTMTLRSQFPNASLKVVPVASSVLISGYVDQPEHIGLIIRMAEEYYPKVINKMAVSGVQQVLLRVKVIEVSRTKLRALGFDWSQISGAGVVRAGLGAFIDATTGPTFSFSVLDGGNSFLGVLDALRKDGMMKILAEPNIVAVSGRPSYFNAGGKYPYVESVDNMGRVQIGWMDYGTRIDFVPMVLGNGRIRLEVRPSISEIDRSLLVGTTPGIKERVVDTGVEMQAGQTLAIAGLVQNRVETENRGLPWISEVPYLGTFFRRVEEKNNEIELLILVTPELVDAMDAHEVSQCGPGMRTTSPSDWELFFQGHLEVPNCCPPGAAQYPGLPADGGVNLPGAPDNGLIIEQPGAVRSAPPSDWRPSVSRPARSVSATVPAGRAAVPGQATAYRSSPPAAGRQPVIVRPATPRNPYTPPRPQTPPAVSESGKQNADANFIGPIGYDVVN